MNEFLEACADAMVTGPSEDDMPFVETTRDIIDHYNKQNPKGFDKAGYFIFQGVKVYEVGTKEEIRIRDRRTSETALFGGTMGIPVK